MCFMLVESLHITITITKISCLKVFVCMYVCMYVCISSVEGVGPENFGPIIFLGPNTMIG